MGIIQSSRHNIQDYRSDLEALRNVLLMTPTGAQVQLGEVAKVEWPSAHLIAQASKSPITPGGPSFEDALRSV